MLFCSLMAVQRVETTTGYAGSIPTVPVAFNANSIFLLKSLLYLLCKGFFNSIIKVIKNMEIKYGKQTRKSKFL
ncbi:hypothetical protein EGX78_04375 [Streptococcus pyogenes]|nr:hypothetical protein EGX78_04375 [Streptococcus pyogenes]OOS19929.1 hypothetical protein B0685_06525 [Streptococcus pyogenes]OUI76589.1 hypothetical protein B7R61_04745 [Streptococcus pyogenes]QBC34831.1 hypothetical protein D0Z58_04240 [Streptococcus pyogenes]QEU35742.1 hypothetical protein FOB76_00110 [Streptococcus pyogenes]